MHDENSVKFGLVNPTNIRTTLHFWHEELVFVAVQTDGQSQWPRGLRHVLSSTVRTLERIRILLEAWMYVRISLCCVILCR
jgi:hypothetical protein